jgi:hypothetical protein
MSNMVTSGKARNAPLRDQRDWAGIVGSTKAFLLCALAGVPLLGLSKIACGAPLDLNRLIQQSTQHAVSIASVRSPQVAAPHKAVYQYGLAPVVVGVTQNGTPVGYRLMLMVVVPSNIDEATETRLRSKTSGLVDPIATELRMQIDALPGFEDPEAITVAAGEDVSKHFENYTSQINSKAHEAFVAATTEFAARFGHMFPNYAATSFLAIGLRPCADPTCPLSEFAHKQRNRSTDRFGKLYGWMRSKGLIAVNQAYMVNPQGSFWSVTAQLDKGYEWHEDFSTEVLQAVLVNAAKRARRAAAPISYSAAQLAGLSREETAHIADVFDSAYAAADQLASNPNAVLQGISDEIGRARLRECVKLRGAFDATDAGKCSGYSLTPTSIATCLSGGDCVPPFGGQVNLDSLTVKTGATIAYLAENASLPRVKLGQLDQVGKLADKCSKSNDGDPRFCLLKATIGVDPKVAKTLECIQAAKAKGPAALPGCAGLGLPAEQQAQIACYQNYSRDYKALALCAGGASLPPAVQKYVSCASNAKATSAGFQEAALCLGAASGSREAACLVRYKDDWQDAALCVGGDHIPPQVQSAVHCAESSDSLTGFGVCMVAKEGSGELQRIAACYAEAQGVPAAVAVCLAAKNLTQDQRIVLECAAETNGAVPATAICAGGKLAMKELMNCQGKNFGEEKCFGEGNEIRKFTKALGFEIGPHSVVADMVNVQLRIYDVAVTPFLKVGTELVTDVIQIANANHLIPDPKDPASFILPGPIGHEIVKGIGSYCDHNWCPWH